MSTDLFSFGGYRLDIFQLYNWGVFDKAVYTLNCAQDTTLLTGSNGSGKTTVVDALLSLLVPPQQRYYNQSSGADKKRDRTEENYVLGAYGNRVEEETAGSKIQSLRNRDTFSVLNGIFIYEEVHETISLLQIRYFSDNTLQHVYALTKQNLTIEQINNTLTKNETSFDKQGKWKRILTEKYNTVFFGDSFKKYSDSFSVFFGFKSDKALRLFSQIVGLKVLGNLTEFIRTNMLEETDTHAQFEKLDSNYIKLIQCNNEILKTKKMLDLLKPIIETGKRLDEEQTEKNRLDNLQSLVPAWYAAKAVALLTEKKESLEKKKEFLEESHLVEKKEYDENDKKISNLNAALASNNTARRIENIDIEIANKTEEKERRRHARSRYKDMALLVGFAIPNNEALFRKNIEAIAQCESSEQETKKLNEEKRFNLQTEVNKLADESNEIKTELASLSKRNTNIPDANILIRDMICKQVSCTSEDIPFAGELIQVAQNEQKWNYSIEKLLHNFALTLLVPEKLYKKVTSYVKDTNMKGRVVYLNIDEQNFSLSYGTSGVALPKDTVPGKLEIKQNTWVTQWLSDYVVTHFNYRCTDNTEEIARAERALSSTGLIKNKMRHEKDDRKTSDNRNLQILGWDNKEKKRLLSSRLDEIVSLQLSQKNSLLEIQNAIQECDLKLRSLSNLKEIRSYQDIDEVSISKNIDSLQDERKKLQATDKELHFLQTQLDEANNKKNEKYEILTKIVAEIGSLKTQISDIDKELTQNKDALELYKNEKPMIELIKEEFQRLSEPKFIDELKINQGKITTSLKERTNGSVKRIQGYTLNLTQNMNALLSPSTELRNKFGDWTADFLHFECSIDYLPDFLTFNDRLQKDDLPKYQEQFHEYLQETMNNDIVDFNQFIQNGEQEIKNAIYNLNTSLKKIVYEQNPDTYLQLEFSKNNDVRINEFKTRLKNAIPNAFDLSTFDIKKEEELFITIKTFLETVKANDANRKYVLDIRNWYNFAASENYKKDGSQKQFYPDSGSLSGGEKAKLTYTILASAIAYQFGLTQEDSNRSFRFAIIDEAFSKSDAANSDYAMRLFKQLELQIMVITPLDKINIVEDYISSVHITENKGSIDSRLLHLSIERFKEQQKSLQTSKENLS